MAADTLKSTSVTNLDAFPIVTDTSGQGAGGYARIASDFVTPTTAGLGNTSSTYRMVRLPTSAIIKSATLSVGAALDTGGASAALTVDLGAYYSDAYSAGGVIDGTPISDSGNSISANCFLAVHSLGTTADAVASGVATTGDFEIDAIYALDRNLINSQLWAQVGLSSDPGGFIDLVLAVHHAADAAAAVPIALVVEYVA